MEASPGHTPPNEEALTPPDERLRQGQRLRRMATLLLLLMAAMLALSTWALRFSSHFAWVQAFAEAALVGGLADWFAVTALFRRPMGLPIPHTAIIPRSKERLGRALALFLKDNFLTRGNVARRLERLDAAAALATILERPAAAGRIRLGLQRLWRGLAGTPAAGAILERLEEGTTARLHDLDLAPLLGRLLAAMLEQGRHRPLIDQLVAWANRTLDSEEKLVRTMVEERTSWLLKLVNLDQRIADELLQGLRGLLADLAADPGHPVREKAASGLRQLAADLAADPKMRARVERLKRQLLANPAVRDWLAGLWKRFRAGLADWFAGDGLDALGRSLAEALRTDPGLADAVNTLARRAVVDLAANHGDSIVTLVSETVRGWDAATLTAKLEGAVLRDLQYIRLNGTLIGGLIGVAIHAVLLLARGS